MMFTFVKNEWLRRYKAPMIFTLIVASMIFISMQFYKTIMENMILLDTFLSTDMMNGILGAFGVDVAAMKSVVGFFSSYSTMWVMMAGGIYFAYFGAEMIAREERLNTISYLAIKPMSRRALFLSKWLALQGIILAFFMGISLVGVLSVGMQSRYAPWTINAEALTEERVNRIAENGEALSPYLKVDEALFDAFTMEMLFGQFTGNEAEIEAAGIDAQGLIASIGDELQNPEVLFDNMLQNPEKYLETFKRYLGDSEALKLDEATFAEAVKEEQAKYRDMKADFLTGKNAIGHYFSYAPEFFLEEMITSNQIPLMIEMHPELSEVVQRVNWRSFAYVIFNMWGVVSALGTFGLCIAAVTIRAQLSGQIAMLISLIFYFMNTILEMVVSLKLLKWLTPFSYADTSGSNPNLINIMILLIVMMGISAIGALRYKNRNIIG